MLGKRAQKTKRQRETEEELACVHGELCDAKLVVKALKTREKALQEELECLKRSDNKGERLPNSLEGLATLFTQKKISAKAIEKMVSAVWYTSEDVTWKGVKLHEYVCDDLLDDENYNSAVFFDLTTSTFHGPFEFCLDDSKVDECNKNPNMICVYSK